MPPALAQQARLVSVGIGDLVFSSDPCERLIIYGLGSCVGVAAYDRAARRAGMLHVMLPPTANPREPLPRYADHGVRALVGGLLDHGATHDRIEVHLAGGASVLAVGAPRGRISIGERNALAVLAALADLGIEPRAADLGGTVGRTLEIAVADGIVTLKDVGGRPRIL